MTSGLPAPSARPVRNRSRRHRRVDGLRSQGLGTHAWRRPRRIVEGIDNAGVPDTEKGEEAAGQVSDWADSSLDDLDQAQDALDEEADSLEEAIEQFQDATGAIAATLVAGVQTLTDVARARPRAGRCDPRHEHVSAAPRGEG